MVSIKVAKRLLKVTYLLSVYSEPGLALTPILVGPHGIGKTQVVKQAAVELGGVALTVEGGSLKEGEITGLPFMNKREDGRMEVQFVPYYHVSSIMALEEQIYNKASKEGFLDKTLTLDNDGNTSYVFNKKTQTIKAKTKAQRVLEGEINKYKFGEDLPAEVKNRLIESGEIQPVFLFIDELNRTEQQTMKELMNIVLNRNVNGYKFPWWVFLVGAINPSTQNSSYATNEMDDAQTSRFIKIKTEADLKQWQEYALDKGLDLDVIEAIASSPEIFSLANESHRDNEDQTPDSRAWEMIENIVSKIPMVRNSKFLTSEDRKFIDEDMLQLVFGKVGAHAGRIFMKNLNEKDSLKPEEILTLTQPNLSETALKKLASQKNLQRVFTVERVIRYIIQIIEDLDKAKTADAKGKKVYENFELQLKEFINLITPSEQISFAKKVIDGPLSKLPNSGRALFNYIRHIFAKDLLNKVLKYEDDKRSLDSQESN